MVNRKYRIEDVHFYLGDRRDASIVDVMTSINGERG